MIPLMLDDKRPIKQIFREYACYCIGGNGITAILLYQEPGQMGMINYAAIYKDEILWLRIDLSGWGVEYL